MDLTGYVIAVCRDKDCDREPCGDAKKPGKQFVKTLEDAIEAVAIPHLVRIKTTKCLGYCKHGRAVEVRAPKVPWRLVNATRRPPQPKSSA